MPNDKNDRNPDADIDADEAVITEETGNSTNPDAQEAVSDRLQPLAPPEIRKISGPRDAVDTGQRRTREKIRQIIVLVGGTGLEAGTRLVKRLEGSGINFGEAVSVDDEHDIHTEVVYVDTNVQDTRKVSNGAQKDFLKKKRLKQAELGRKGVHVITLHDHERDDYLSEGLRELHTSPPVPPESDSKGAQADPRIGVIAYLCLRGDETNPNNPLNKIRDLLTSWISSDTEWNKEGVKLDVVGGLHGGTGPLALLLTADVQQAMKDLHIENAHTTRYCMTSESAGLDKQMAKDGSQHRRMRNTITEVLKANAAFIDGEVEIEPGTKIPIDRKAITFVVGGAVGRNGTYKQVPVKGSHYYPTEAIASHLHAKAKGIDHTSGIQSNKCYPSLNECEVGADNRDYTPRKMLATLGNCRLEPAGSRAYYERELKLDLYGTALGLDRCYNSVANRGINESFSDGEVKKMLATRAPREAGEKDPLNFNPALLGATAKEKRDTARFHFTAFQNRVDNALENEAAGARAKLKENLKEQLMEQLFAIKKRAGLQTALRFAGLAMAKLDELKGDCAERKAKLDGQITNSKGQRVPYMQQMQNTLNGLITQLEKTKPGIGKRFLKMFRLADYSAIDTSVEQQATRLLEFNKKFTERKREQALLSGIEEEIFNEILAWLQRECDALRQEIATGREILDNIPKVDTKSYEADNIHVLPVDPDFSYDRTERSQTLREGTMPESRWNESMMRQLLGKITVTPEEVDVLATYAADPDYQMTLDRYAQPVSRFAGRKSRKNRQGASKSIGVTLVPGKQDDAEASKIPSPVDCPARAITNGELEIMREEHKLNMLDDAYLRECAEVLLATVPTCKQAEVLAQLNEENADLQEKPNREAQFMWVGGDKILYAFFRALAERKFEEERSGEVRQCHSEDCGVMYHRTEEEVKKDEGCFCPGCRKLPQNETDQAIARANELELERTGGRKVLVPGEAEITRKKDRALAAAAEEKAKQAHTASAQKFAYEDSEEEDEDGDDTSTPEEAPKA